MADSNNSGAAANADRPNVKAGQTEADAAAVRQVEEARKDNKGSDVTVTQYFTKEGVPVEPSSIPSTQPFGPTPDVSTRPDVVEKKVPLDVDGNSDDKDAK